jgi:hypothetical protein
MDFTDAKTSLNILLSNTAGFTFNDSEITQILTDAWNDKYAVNPLVWDDSLKFSVTPVPQYQYPIPDTLTTVSGIYITRSDTNLPDPIDDSLWEVVGSNIQFKDKALQTIPDGYILYLKGRYKVTTDDTLDDSGLQQYVLALAGYNALRYLLLKKTMLFVKNDTSVAEILAARKELYADMVRWRQQLNQEFIGV